MKGQSQVNLRAFSCEGLELQKVCRVIIVKSPVDCMCDCIKVHYGASVGRYVLEIYACISGMLDDVGYGYLIVLL